MEELQLAEIRGPRTRKAQRVAEDVNRSLGEDGVERPWFLETHLSAEEGGTEDPEVTAAEVAAAAYGVDGSTSPTLASPVGVPDGHPGEGPGEVETPTAHF